LKVDSRRPRRWVSRLLLLDVAGLLIFLFGMHPSLFGMPYRPGFGYLKVFVFLTGLALVTLSSYVIAGMMRPEGQPASLLQEIGARLVATGYFLAALSSTADLIGLGSEHFPQPMHFGVLQSLGLLVGVLIILIGLLTYYPRGRKRA
jgi:hypothetical protein